MDTNDIESSSSNSVIMEKQNRQPAEALDTKTSNTTVTEMKEDVGLQSETNKLESETVKPAAQKEPIEILNVEMVASGKDSVQDSSMECENVKERAENKTESDKEIEIESPNPGSETILKIVEETPEDKQDNESHIDNEKRAEETTNATPSGLGLLAQYDSDNEDKISDTDSVVEVPLISAQDYRNQVVEIGSDSDSDDSSSSDVEYLNELRKTIDKRTEVVDDDDDDEDANEENAGKKKRTTKLRVKGELMLEDLPPIQDLQITVPEDECIEFGKIHSVVDQLVLVSALPNAILLDLATVIFLEKGQKVLGEVFDVLGQVADPLYCVRFNSNKQIKEKQINVGNLVYVAPKTQYTQYVILSSLMKVKGSDASWENDMEPPPRFLEYSDDEQEQLARRQLRNKDRPVDSDDPTKRPRTGEDDEVSGTSSRNYHSNTQQKNRSNEQRNNRGGFSGNARHRYNGPPQNQHPNHHRSSWHSNYNPQNYPPQATANYGMPSHNQPSQSYAPMYGMPPMHNMPYPMPPQASQYGAPPMMHQNAPHLMPNTFTIRPPTLQGHPPHHPQYTSPPPPPPGSQ